LKLLKQWCSRNGPGKKLSRQKKRKKKEKRAGAIIGSAGNHFGSTSLKLIPKTPLYYTDYKVEWVLHK
jgi:hypothetical protein